MALASTTTHRLSVAGSSKESSHGSSSALSTAPKNRQGHHTNVASRNPKASVMRASTATSATTMSKLIRSASTASTSRESKPASVDSTVRPPSTASRSSRASTLRASTVTSATSASNFHGSNSSFSSVSPSSSPPAASTTSLSRSGSKHAPSIFSTAANRLMWGRQPPGHSSLKSSQIESLTRILSLPSDTPMLSSLIGALGLPLSRSQFSPTPRCFCDSHFWLEQKYTEELTEVISHEIGPQLDKLRIAPTELLSKKTQRILSTLEPYKDIFTGIGNTSSSSSSFTTASTSKTTPTCPACALSLFFQNPTVVTALTACIKSRKHRNRPWPSSMAWFEPRPGKGVDWEAKWKADGKSMARDRIRVQRWRRQNRLEQYQVFDAEQGEKTTQVLGHGPGQGCDFCDNRRLERADGLKEEDEEEEEEWERTPLDELDTIAESTETVFDEGGKETSVDDSQTLRAMQEEQIIGRYLKSSSPSSSSSSIYPPPPPNQRKSLRNPSREVDEEEHGHMLVYRADERGHGGQKGYSGKKRRDNEGGEEKERASQWARSYTRLVDKL